MSFDDPAWREMFFKLHSGLPREAPGSDEATLRALQLSAPKADAKIADMGSGPGAACIPLLKALPQASVFACDLHEPFVVEARARAAAAGVADRIDAQVADMGAPPLPPASLDLIWAEGSLYALGIAEGLRAWRPLLAPGGRVAFSEAIRRRTPMAAAAEAFWQEYPALTDLAGTRARIAGAGYREVAAFDLPAQAWRAYLDPLEARANALQAEATTQGARAALDATLGECALFRDHGDDYGYAFFVVEPA